MSEHLDARLDARRTERLLAHLAACPECRARFDALSRTVGLVRALPRLAPNPDLARLVRQRLASAPASPPNAAPQVAFFARPPARIALAAGVLLMVCLYGWVWRPDSRPIPSPKKAPPPPCVAPTDEPAPCMPAEKALDIEQTPHVTPAPMELPAAKHLEAMPTITPEGAAPGGGPEHNRIEKARRDRTLAAAPPSARPLSGAGRAGEPGALAPPRPMAADAERMPFAGKAELEADAAKDKSDVVPHERRFRADGASVAGILDALRPPREKRASARAMTPEAAVEAKGAPERAGAAPEGKEFEKAKTPTPVVTRTEVGISEIRIRVRQSDLPRVLANLTAGGVVVKPTDAPASAPAPVVGRQDIAVARSTHATDTALRKSGAPLPAGAATYRAVKGGDIPDNGWVTLVIEVPDAP